MREENLWEHLERRRRAVTPGHICIRHACVYSDAQFIPPRLINRSDTQTGLGGRGKVEVQIRRGREEEERDDRGCVGDVLP